MLRDWTLWLFFTVAFLACLAGYVIGVNVRGEPVYYCMQSGAAGAVLACKTEAQWRSEAKDTLSTLLGARP